MKKYLHRVLGLYETVGAAELARERLVQRGLPAVQLTVLQPGRDGMSRERRPDSDDVLLEMLRDATYGGIVGVLVGLAGIAALELARDNLFESMLGLSTLIILGWSVSIGAFVGAAVGARSRKGSVADLLKVSLASGHIVLVAHTTTEEQTTVAQTILGESLNKAAHA